MKLMYRLRYLLFRWYYTYTHLLFFKLLPDTVPPPTTDRTGRNTVIVCGAEFNNALSIQKLTLLVARLHGLNPRLRIVLFSKQAYASEERIDGLDVLPWDFHERARALGILARLLYPRGRFDESALCEIAVTAIAMVDLGHYQANSLQGTGWTANMLTNVVFAKRFGLPFYFFSQSFSPFRYPRQMARILTRMLRTILPYAETVYVREHWGLEALNSLSTAIATESCPEFLLFDDLSPLPTVKARKLCLIPGHHLMASGSRFQCWRDALPDTWLLDLVIYDAPEELAYERLPAEQKTTSATLSEVVFTRSLVTADTLYITSKYHAALVCLLAGQPALLLEPDAVSRSLYEALGLESLIVEKPDQLEEKLAAVCEGENFAAIQALAQTRLQTLREQVTLPLEVIAGVPESRETSG